MTTASRTASTALESRKRASALGPEIPALVGRPRPLAVTPKAAGERKEGVVERERCDIPRSHGPNRPGGAADRAGRDPPAPAELDARQLLTAQEAPDRALRHPQTARRLGRREPSRRHLVILSARSLPIKGSAGPGRRSGRTRPNPRAEEPPRDP